MMVAFIGILGALQLLSGIYVYVMAASAIHEILGAVLFGMGTIALGLGILIEKADKQLAMFQKLNMPKG